MRPSESITVSPTERNSRRRVTAGSCCAATLRSLRHAPDSRLCDVISFSLKKPKQRKKYKKIGRALRCWSFIRSTSSGFHLPVLWLPLTILIENIPWNFLTLPWPPHHVTHTHTRARARLCATQRSHDLRYSPPPSTSIKWP